VYSPAERSELRDALVAAARADERLSGVAVFGSAALGQEDRWSDVDLAFGVTDSEQLSTALAGWTASMYSGHGAVHHVDVMAGDSVYRVFLLSNTLQVDLAFSPAKAFGARGPKFRLLSGSAADWQPAPPTEPQPLIGMGWLHALHARSALARGRRWQAEYMISGVRDHALALACLRYGLATAQGRGVDHLPKPLLTAYEDSLIRSVEIPELQRAFGASVDHLLQEAREADATLADRLAVPVSEIASSIPNDDPERN